MSIGSTHFNSDIYADKFVLNTSPSPPEFLLSNGTTTKLYDSEYIIVNTPPFNSITNITESKGDVWYDTTDQVFLDFNHLLELNQQNEHQRQ